MPFIKGLIATALFTGLFQTAWAQSDGPEFIYPTEKDDGKLAFYDNTEVIVGFRCPTDSIVLRIYCNDEEKDDYVHQAAVFADIPCEDEEYSFRVDFDYYAKECWFNMRDSDGTGFTGINSPKFSLVRTAAEATFGLDQPTESITTSAIPSSTGSSDASLTASSGSDATTDANTSGSTNNGSDSGGLTTGAKAGIGVGVSLGVLGIAALIGAFFIVRRKKKNASPPPPSHDGPAPFGRQELHADSEGFKQPDYQVHEYYGAEGYKGVVDNQAPPSELAGTNARYELEDTRRTHEVQG